ncbi:hypothetical protein [Streptomyces rubiginosohelvolus]|uniref:hypothetical protein n=1 Tax=Streptomyces rubiginosohelvolus TaxID=67362 RepID=UPI0036ADCE15
MADSEVRTGSAQARIMLTDLVPEGRTMVEIVSDDETVICVRRGEMSEALVEEWNDHLAHATRSGCWLRAETDERPGGRPPI